MKRKNLPKWTRFLSACEIQHIQDSGGLKLTTVISNEQFQHDKIFPCWECVLIAKTLRENGIIK